MVLLDHFHPPLSHRRHWHSFHNAWATYIASGLNQALPPNFFAEPNVQFGIEIDVATFEESDAEIIPFPLNWQPPDAQQRFAFEPMAENVEISIFNNEAGPKLLSAIELVSPANKDRAAHRSTFVSKCETYLRAGIGLVVVDVVTSRLGNLHNELLDRLGLAAVALPMAAELYATAYRVVERSSLTQLETWQETLSVGCDLPTLPLWLGSTYCLPLDLSMSYQRTCQEQRITANSA